MSEEISNVRNIKLNVTENAVVENVPRAVDPMIDERLQRIGGIEKPAVIAGEGGLLDWNILDEDLPRFEIPPADKEYIRRLLIAARSEGSRFAEESRVKLAEIKGRLLSGKSNTSGQSGAKTQMELDGLSRESGNFLPE